MRYLFAILFFFPVKISGQNLLPFIWQVSSSDTIVSAPDTGRVLQSRWMNLLLSWERQGYFARTGTRRLWTEFEVPITGSKGNLQLQVGLECRIKAVYVNGVLIGQNLPYVRHTKRDTLHRFELPVSLLRAGKNRLSVVADNFAYTGGKSNNRCLLLPAVSDTQESVAFGFDNADRLYLKNAPVIKLTCRTEAMGKADVYVVNDFHDTLYQKTFSLKKGQQELSIDLRNSITQPGFYECIVVQKGRGYKGDVKWFAKQPENITGTTQTPDGFARFWQESLQELNSIPPGFTIIKSDSLSRGNRDAFIISYQSAGNITIRGYYFVPRTSGKHAAVLHLPGYGYGYRNLEKFINSRENVAELALCVRGHGISADVFHPGFGVPGIWGYQLCNQQTIAYRSIYLDCARAIQFLCSRPEIDSTRLGVMGASQGGGLALATAGLMPDHVKALAYFDPFPCDVRDLIQTRKLCVEELESYRHYYNDACSFEQVLAVQDFIDAKNFAPLIKAKTFYATGLLDDDCPSRVGFAAYNEIRGEKRFVINADDSHVGESDPYTAMFLFLKRALE